MPNKKVHMLYDKSLFNSTIAEVHEWMDEPVKELGFHHREERHDFAAVIYCGKRWGILGFYTSFLHLLVDNDLNCKLDPRFFDRDVEKIKVDENVRLLCQDYANFLVRVRYNHIQSYNSKLYYSDIIKKIKSSVPKNVRNKIKSILSKQSDSAKIIFYSEKVSVQDWIESYKNEVAKENADIESGKLNGDELERIAAIYKRELYSDTGLILKRFALLQEYSTYKEIKNNMLNIDDFVLIAEIDNLFGTKVHYKVLFKKNDAIKLINSKEKNLKEIIKKKIQFIANNRTINSIPSDIIFNSKSEEKAKDIFFNILQELPELLEIKIKESETSWIICSEGLLSGLNKFSDGVCLDMRKYYEFK